ncbi:MAG: uracil-DNA glycosylase family protein [Euryarchaeota archaeon]|nr:uracil-DNA glycosylase family protein [Euryarchaeota archaeon]
MAGEKETGWEGFRAKVHGQCSGCPRNANKMPVVFQRKGSLASVDFVILSQEPGYWLRSEQGNGAEQRLTMLCTDGTPIDDVRKANPLSKVLQIFGRFDPKGGRVYWTHALKCVPERGDRDINKEWRKSATRCREHFIEELNLLGRSELNVLAFGKYALEMCLDIFEGQDIDQELSISEFMQGAKLPLIYKYKFKDGTVKNVNLFVFANPSSEVVKIMKSGGKMTVEEIQDLEMKKISESFKTKAAR